ncbi:hypothetical protein HYX08_04925 [Candidatus Woesearchaeota archaeon]|nr:hypothetical protein [Candidatus Woesearchaeota archaeon]
MGKLETEVSKGIEVGNDHQVQTEPIVINNGAPNRKYKNLNLLKRTADKFSPEIFYVAKPASDSSGIKRASLEEILAFGLRTGRLPTNGDVTFVGGGGSAKGYWILGFATELRKHIEISKYVTTSVSSLLSLGQITDEETFVKFALKIPELLPERDYHRAIRLIKAAIGYLPGGYVKDRFDRLLKIMHYFQAEDLMTENGELVRNPKGVVQTDAFVEAVRSISGERTIGDLGNFIIMAIDYIHKRPVALGKEYREMPLYNVLAAAIALAKIIPYKGYNGSLLGDAGEVYNFPLLLKHIGKNAGTVVGVDLNYNNGIYKGLPFFAADEAWQGHVRNVIASTEQVEKFSEIPVDVLTQGDDYHKQQLKLFAPKIDGVLPGQINIPMPEREKLIELGRQAAKAFISRLRQPLWSIPYSFQYAT